jgi:hypothetical protein
MDRARSAGDFRAGRGQGRCQSVQDIRPIVEPSLSLLEDRARVGPNASDCHSRGTWNRSIIRLVVVRRC